MTLHFQSTQVIRKDSIIRKIIKKIYPYLILAFVSPFCYWNDGLFNPKIWEWVDSIFPLIPQQAVIQNYNIWNPNGLGQPQIISGLPFYLSVQSLTSLGIPMEIVSKLVYIAPVALRGIAMYYLITSIIGKSKTESVIGGLAGSTFYMFFPMDMYGSIGFVLIPATLALGTAFFIQGLKTKQNRYIALFALSLILPETSLIAILYLAVIVVAYWLFSVLIEKNLISSAAYMLKIVVASICVSAYYFLPTLDLLMSGSLSTYFTNPFASSLNLGNIAGESESLLYTFRGIWGFNATQYAAPLMVIVAFAIVILCYMAPLFDKSKNTLFFAIIGVIAALFGTSLYYPISRNFFMWGYSVMAPLFERPDYFTYFLFLSYALLLGVSVSKVLTLTQRRRFRTKLCVIILVFSLVAISSYPVLAGYGFRPTNGGITIPNDYYQLRDYLAANSNMGEKVLTLPYFIGYDLQLNWAPYTFEGLGDYVCLFSPIPTIGGGWEPINYAPAPITDAVNSLQQPDNLTVEYLQAIGVKYIVVHQDYNLSAWVADPTPLINTLNASPYFEAQKFNDFTLYTLKAGVSGAYIIPLSQISNITNEILVPSQELETNCTFTYSSPEVIVGSVSCSVPFIVVLAQSFDNGWKCYINGELIGNQNHIEVNGYANAWIVNNTGKMDITIRFEPQSYVELGSAITIVSVLGIIIYLILPSVYRKKSKQ